MVILFSGHKLQQNASVLTALQLFSWFDYFCCCLHFFLGKITTERFFALFISCFSICFSAGFFSTLVWKWWLRFRKQLIQQKKVQESRKFLLSITAFTLELKGEGFRSANRKNAINPIYAVRPFHFSKRSSVKARREIFSPRFLFLLPLTLHSFYPREQLISIFFFLGLIFPPIPLRLESRKQYAFSR